MGWENTFRQVRVADTLCFSFLSHVFFQRIIEYVFCVYRTRRGFLGSRIISSAKPCIRGKSGHPVCWPKVF